MPALKGALREAKRSGDADAVAARWSDILRNVRSGVLACKSRIIQRLPHLTRQDAEDIEEELRGALVDLSENAGHA